MSQARINTGLASRRGLDVQLYPARAEATCQSPEARSGGSTGRRCRKIMRNFIPQFLKRPRSTGVYAHLAWFDTATLKLPVKSSRSVTYLEIFLLFRKPMTAWHWHWGISAAKVWRPECGPHIWCD